MDDKANFEGDRNNDVGYYIIIIMMDDVEGMRIMGEVIFFLLTIALCLVLYV